MPTRRFDGRVEAIRPICQFVLEGAHQGGFDRQAQFQIELACDEACTNIIQHAYGSERQGDIVAGWHLTDDELIVTLVDSGPPFDIDTVRAVALPSSPHDVAAVKIGGLGVHFMRTLMDRVMVTPEPGGGNRLTMAKRLPPDARGPVRTVALEGAWLVMPRGRIDHQNGPAFEEALLAALDAGHTHIVVDLSAVVYINSGGLRVLVTIWRRLNAADGMLILSGLSQKLAQVIETIGFDRVFHITGDVAGAQALIAGR